MSIHLIMTERKVRNPAANLMKYLIGIGTTTGEKLLAQYEQFGYQNKLKFYSDLSDLADVGLVYVEGWADGRRKDTWAFMKKRVISNVRQPLEIQSKQ